jgi:hypothetical protein
MLSILATSPTGMAFMAGPRPAHTVQRAPEARMATLEPGAKVLVTGKGPVMLLAAKLAAVQGFEVCCLLGTEPKMAEDLIGDPSLPLTLLPVQGGSADPVAVEAAVKSASGLIIAFDGEEVLSDAALDIFMPKDGTNFKHVSLLSRHLNGEGMGFFAKAAKVAANAEIWAAPEPVVEGFRSMELTVRARAKEVGATSTVIRAGTLKGGGSGDTANGSGDPSLLVGEVFYKLGQQDVVNWRMLFDCDTLGVVLKKGDVLPGPGFKAAFGATSPEACEGDSGRGGVANALVEALRCEAAAESDFGVATASGRASPSPEEWKQLFAKA